jgi:hypothetical protein
MNFTGPDWRYVLDAALADRIDFLKRLEARPMNHATEPEKAAHQVALYHAQLAICDIMKDIEKEQGTT